MRVPTMKWQKIRQHDSVKLLKSGFLWRLGKPARIVKVLAFPIAFYQMINRRQRPTL